MNTKSHENTCANIPCELKNDILKTSLYKQHIASQQGVFLETFWDCVNQYKKTLKNPKYACLIESCYVNKKTEVEIASILGCSVAQVVRAKPNAIHSLISHAYGWSKRRIQALEDATTDNPEDKSIYDIDVSTRAFNCIARNHCRTIGDILKAIRDIPNWRNCGVATQAEIINALSKKGYLRDELLEEIQPVSDQNKKIKKS